MIEQQVKDRFEVLNAQNNVSNKTKNNICKEYLVLTNLLFKITLYK